MDPRVDQAVTKTAPLRLRLRRSSGRAALLPTVGSFDEVHEAEVAFAPIDHRGRLLPRSRSVQPAVHPKLVSSTLKQLPVSRVAIVRGGRLASQSGAVITQDGRLVLETLWDLPHWERSFNPPPALPPAARIPGRHASLMSLWCHNYHHWMFEALPRLAVLEASGVEFDGLIVPEDLKPFQKQTLRLAGVPESRLVPFTGEHVQPDELVWATPLSPFEQPTRYEIDWLRRLAGARPPQPTERFYIPRRDARRIVNERKVRQILRDAGFDVLEPDKLDVKEQIDRFASASMVVGSHGAAFSNCIFSERLSALEFFQEHHVNISTTAAIVAAGNEHWSLVCRRVPGLRRRRNQDLHVPLAALTETLAAMGS